MQTHTHTHCVHHCSYNAGLKKITRTAHLKRIPFGSTQKDAVERRGGECGKKTPHAYLHADRTHATPWRRREHPAERVR